MCVQTPARCLSQADALSPAEQSACFSPAPCQETCCPPSVTPFQLPQPAASPILYPASPPPFLRNKLLGGRWHHLPRCSGFLKKGLFCTSWLLPHPFPLPQRGTVFTEPPEAYGHLGTQGLAPCCSLSLGPPDMDGCQAGPQELSCGVFYQTLRPARCHYPESN